MNVDTKIMTELDNNKKNVEDFELPPFFFFCFDD